MKFFRWLTQIWVSLALAFLGFFLLAHLFGNEQEAMNFNNNSEMFAFAFFPVLYWVGLLISFRWKYIGGGMALLSMLVMFGYDPRLVKNLLFLLFFTPAAILPIIYTVLDKEQG